MLSRFNESIVHWIRQQAWLDKVANPIQKVMHKLYAGSGTVSQGVENTMNGVFLGHPLHPVITDIPIGAWTAAVVLDGVSGRNRSSGFEKAADLAIGIGAVSAVGAAAAGLTDWQHLKGEPRRFGILHALLNTASLIFFTSSLVARRVKNRSLGRSLALAGYGMVAASGFLGGDLVFRQKIGVSHAQPAATVPDWTPVLAEGQLREGVMTRAEVQGVKMLFLRRGNQVFTINEVCAHLGGPLSEGKLDGNTVICPWHGSRYDLATGTVLDGPSAYSQACYQTRVRSGVVEIRQAQAEGVQQPSAEITMS